MVRPPKTSTLVLVGLVLILSAVASAGQWITPDWPAGKEPQFKPVPLFWFEVKECPVVYRTEIEVPKEADRATVLLRTSGYVYVYVDGRLAFSWAPQGEDKKAGRPAVPADRNRVHEVDLSEFLTPGKHVVGVSAPKDGFVMDGGLYAGTKRLAPLVSDGKWTVSKFAPTTILEDEPLMKPGETGAPAGASPSTGPATCPATASVKTAEEWKADEDALAKAYASAFVGRYRRYLDEAVWRAELLARKGIYIVNGSACGGWGGPPRIPEARKHANEALEACKDASAKLTKPGGAIPDGAAALDKALPELQALRRSVQAVAGEVDLATRCAENHDEAGMLSAVSPLFAGPWPARVNLTGDVAADGDHVRTVRRTMESQLRRPLSRWNESRYDRLGWIDHPALTDSDLGRWGVRVNPVTGPTKVAGPQKWLFSTDPKDEGVKELRHTIGYNVENQWPTINGTQSWTADKRFADYKGVAWYRGRVHVPGEWAGGDVVMGVNVAGKEQLWLNDNDVTKYGAGEGKRTYKLPANTVAFGGENFLALRVSADGQQRGLVGAVEVSCPGLEGEEGKKTPPVDVLVTPLSPCVILTPVKDELWIHHAGKGKLVLPGSGRPILEMDQYAPAGPGKLPAGNWAMLWLTPATPSGVERPIQLVFEKSPAGIVCEQGVTRIKLAQAGVRIIAVRPWAKGQPPAVKDEMTVLKAAAFWSRAALAVPVNFASVTTVRKQGEDYANISIDKVPPGPVLSHDYVYDYLMTKDEWDTEPLRIAPVPAFCSYAMDCRYPGLDFEGGWSDKQSGLKAEVVQDGGLLAPYRAVVNAYRLRYAYPVEPYPRFIGFTSWMFSGVDAGVPGNKREMELMAAVGANSYRPQHNWSDQLPPKWFHDGNKTRVVITADYCKAAGINYMNNVEQTLDRHQLCREDYQTWLKTVLFPHFEKLVPQLADRPYWQVAYDLINEPFDHKAVAYNPAMKELTKLVRAKDKTHLCYIEPCEAWGAIQQLALVEPTRDPLTVYSFHDYNFRLHKPEDRWPTLERDIRNIYRMWMPALVYGIKHGVCMHCGEFGGFDGASDDSLAQKTLMNDFFRIFDQFAMHHHYYSGRTIFQRLADGSLRPSNVVRAYREYFRTDPNRYYKKWEGYPLVK